MNTNEKKNKGLWQIMRADNHGNIRLYQLAGCGVPDCCLEGTSPCSAALNHSNKVFNFGLPAYPALSLSSVLFLMSIKALTALTMNRKLSKRPL